MHESGNGPSADACACTDVVIVNDFGHGLLGAMERSILSEAGFLAVNAQTNAGNFGFNLITSTGRMLSSGTTGAKHWPQSIGYRP
jgi:hypothetical protein